MRDQVGNPAVIHIQVLVDAPTIVGVVNGPDSYVNGTSASYTLIASDADGVNVTASLG